MTHAVADARGKTQSRWWMGVSQERYWLEITNRQDIGTNLKAPQVNENGRPYWGYSLINEIQHGDLVLHWDLKKDALVGFSYAVGSVWEDRIFWAALGTSARRAGTTPHERPGWCLGLIHYKNLPRGLTLERVMQARPQIRNIYKGLGEKYGSAKYLPFTIYKGSRELTPAQAYLTKFPRDLVSLFDELAVLSTMPFGEPPTDTASETASAFGAQYRPADELASVSARDPFAIDPALVERGLRGHAITQNSLAEFVRQCGAEPCSPDLDEPSFDLGWKVGGVRFVAEVKSLTAQNEERQLRLGLGQVLRYRHLLRSPTSRVVAVLAVEKVPTDGGWMSLCTELDVYLVWPGSFETLRNEIFR